jgi:hypothetical protein
MGGDALLKWSCRPVPSAGPVVDFALNSEFASAFAPKKHEEPDAPPPFMIRWVRGCGACMHCPCMHNRKL